MKTFSNFHWPWPLWFNLFLILFIFVLGRDEWRRFAARAAFKNQGEWVDNRLSNLLIVLGGGIGLYMRGHSGIIEKPHTIIRNYGFALVILYISLIATGCWIRDWND